MDEREQFQKWWSGDVITKAVDMAWTDEKCELAFIAGYRAALAPAQHHCVDMTKLFEILMQQNIVTGSESYLSLRCVGVPPTEEEFVSAVSRIVYAAPSPTKDHT